MVNTECPEGPELVNETQDLDGVSKTPNKGFRVEPIPTRPNLSVEDFEENYLQKCQPVLLTDAEAQHWPCMKWKLKDLREQYGDTVVKVRKKASQREYEEGTRYQIAEMGFGEYADRILRGERAALQHYMAIQNLKMVFPVLDSEVPQPAFVRRKHNGPYMWIAPKGHYEFCHFDPDDNFLVCCEGRKRVRLWLPQDFRALYPNPLGSMGKTVQFAVNSDMPDLSRHPLASSATCYEATVEPGQMCFIPAFTLHQVTAVDNSVSVNMFFGDESPQQNAFFAKILRPPQREAFTYWLLNIIEQNRRESSFPNLLSYLPRCLAQFASKLWGERPTPDQIEEVVKIICDHLGIARQELPVAPDYETRKHAPQLKIRGLLFRDQKQSAQY